MSAQAMGWVLDHSQATGAARLVALAIANHIASDTAEGWCYIATICQSARVSPDSYRRAMKALEDLGEFERETNAGGTLKTRADAKPNLFRMPKFGETRPLQDATPAGKRPRQPAPGPPLQDAPPATPAGCLPITVIDSTVQEPSSITELLAAFDRFLAVYPRRVAPGAARKAWPKAVKAAGGTEVIIDGARRYAEECSRSRREPQFIAHPATWLNAERWEDAPDPGPRQPGERKIMQYDGRDESESGRIFL